MVDLNKLVSDFKRADAQEQLKIKREVRQELKERGVKGFNRAQIGKNGIFIKDKSFEVVQSTESTPNQSFITQPTTNRLFSPVPEEDRLTGGFTDANTGKARFIDAKSQIVRPNFQSEKGQQFAVSEPEIKKTGGLKRFEGSFFSIQNQKQRLTNVKDTFKLAGIKAGNFAADFALGKKNAFGELNKPVNPTRAEQVTNIATNPVVTVVLPTLVAAPALIGGTSLRKFAVKQGTTQVTKKATIVNFGRVAGTELVKIQAGGFGIRKAGDALATSRLTQDQKTLIQQNDDAFNKALKAGFASQQQAAQQKGIVSSLTESLNVGFGDRREFEKGVQSSLKDQGFTDSQILDLTQAANLRRESVKFSEPAQFLNIGRGSEKIGRAGFAAVSSFGGTAKKGFQATAGTFARGVTAVAPAGFVEGFFSVQDQQKFRSQPVDFRQSLIGGGFGALTAGAISGTVAAGQVATSSTGRGIGKITNIAANIADPLEKPSDLLASAETRFTRRVLNLPEFKANIQGKGKKLAFETSFDPSPGFKKNQARLQKAIGSEAFRVKTGRFGGGSLVPVVPQAQSKTQTQTDVLPKTRVKFPTIPNIFTNPKTKPPVPVIGSVPVQVPVFPSVPTQPKVSPPVTPSVPVFPAVNVKPSNLQPNLKIIPPLPFDLNLPGGRGRRFKGKRSVFVNEIALANTFLGTATKRRGNKKKSAVRGILGL